MGAGKTVGCINMINSSPSDKKFIFITPYLDEVERIKSCCSDKNFVSPEKKFRNGRSSKLDDLHELLRQGANIASTHALLGYYTDETVELLKAGNYTLILDEVIDLFAQLDIDSDDVKLLLNNGILTENETGRFEWSGGEYSCGSGYFAETKRMAESRVLAVEGDSIYFWIIPIEIFRSFSEVYVLTYLFDSSILKHYLDAHKIDYELIGTKKVGNTYQFCSIEEMDRKIDLRNKIHILDNENMNEIGDDKFSLSMAWFNRAKNDVTQTDIKSLKNSIYGVFRREFDGSAEERMWTTFNKFKNDLKGKGYTNGFVPFNKKAVNDLAHKKYLAYCVNVFLQPWMINYLKHIGAKNVNQDMYALSIMVQWIFRSAIRKGEEIWIYVPNARMRYLLTEWINRLYQGRDLEPIKYCVEHTKQNHLAKTARILREKGKKYR